MHLERLILILETVAHADGALNVAEICKATNFPKPTTYRLVQDLVSTGLLEPEVKGRFLLGARLRRMTRDDLGERDVIDAAATLLQEAADTHEAAFFLSRLRGRGVEIIYVATPRDSRISYLHPGLGFRPLHACSCAKAIAAFTDEPLLTAALEGRLRAYTEHTRTDLVDLETEFKEIREQGFAECVQELEVGMCSVAAPVHLVGLGPMISLGATGSERLFTKDYRTSLGGALVEMGKAFAVKLQEKTKHARVDKAQAG